MATSTARAARRPALGEPAWDIAQLFPGQGTWSESEFFSLPDNRRVEFADGYVEVLPVPTTSHQLIVAYLYRTLLAFVDSMDLGLVLFSGVKVRLRKAKYREPDIVFMFAKHSKRIGEEYWQSADLVMEVVSGNPEDRARDLVTKPTDYARARIPEYWIVDPEQFQITVLRLSGRKYVVHGKFGRGERATSVLLDGFAVLVNAVFKAGKLNGNR